MFSIRRSNGRLTHTIVLCTALLLVGSADASAAPDRQTANHVAEAATAAATIGLPAGNDWCGYKPPEEFYKEFRDAVDNGLVPDPSTKALAPVAPRMEVGATNIGPLGPDDIFPWEDTDQILRTNYSSGQLFSLMTASANALMAEHGDQWDFIAYWMNFAPATQNGAAAFYMGMENNVTGLGQGFYNQRSGFGLSGNNVEGLIQMFYVNDWAPGTGFDANATRLVLGQEFEHRWGVFLNGLPGRVLQGDDGNCGRSAHWSFRLDGGGSGMEIAEWNGVNPAIKQPGALHFNSDIANSVFSYPDLYLMGYVSPQELDDSMAEFRFMNNSTCGQNYSGAISTVTSADVIASNGARIPDVTSSQKHYKTAWVMFYQPGSPPTATEIQRALDIMEQHQIDWNTGTLGRGTLDNSIAFGNFLTSPVSGPAPLSVDFTYSSEFPTSSWKWHFGDGDSATVTNPSHVYAPGIHDVELRVGTDFGERYTIKRDHITVWADTCEAVDTTVPPNAAGYIEIHGVNALPITELVLPIRMTNVSSKFFLDSISFVGTRLDYFESSQIVFDNLFSGELAVRIKADNGGGSPPLPPGSGLVARVHFRSRFSSTAGDTAFVDAAQLGAHSFTATTTTTAFTPVFNGGTVRVVAPLCDCPWQGDLDSNGARDAVDLSMIIDVVFFGVGGIQDPGCPSGRADFNSDGFADAIDISAAIDHIFLGGVAPADPCAP